MENGALHGSRKGELLDIDAGQQSADERRVSCGGVSRNVMRRFDCFLGRLYLAGCM